MRRAAGEFLSHVFPARRAELRALAELAAISRVYGGIHYRFDSEAGLEAGFAIGRLAIEEDAASTREGALSWLSGSELTVTRHDAI